ncbi:MAG: PD40 domain-containing protein [Chloroflexi bacterium]|nr:PD40 domain-containing protein [Chloroflexota bacterium]
MKRSFTFVIVLLTTFGLLARPQPSGAQTYYYIAFQSNRDGSDDIFIMDTSGGGVRNLTANRANDRHPDWSPDGTQITFASDRSGNFDVYVMQNNGAEPRNLTNNSANDNSPDWSPDGSTILFISDRDGGQDVYTVAVADGAVQRITSNGTRKSAPTWSPDGTKIAYWEGAEGLEQIVTFDLASGASTTLTSGAPSSWAAWSPDGSSIAYFQNTALGTADIYEIPAGGGLARNLTDNPANDVRPAYAPDGNEIVFASDRTGNLEIFSSSREGGFIRQLTQNAGDDTSPAWQPIPAPVQEAEGSAVLVQNGLQLAPSGDLSGSEQSGQGQLRLFAPSQVTMNDLIIVRLEIEPDSATVATPTPSGYEPTLAPAIREQTLDVYTILGAELRGVDLDRFDIYPSPTDYVLRLNLDEVNYWEWELVPRGNQALGVNFLSANVYQPVVQADGTVAKNSLFDARFTIEVVQGGNTEPTVVPTTETPLAAAAPVADNRLFALTYSDENSFALVVLASADLSTARLTGAGYLFGEFFVSADFPDLETLGWTEGVCLIYVRDGSENNYHPPRPCNPERTFQQFLNSGDVFWYDDFANEVRDVIVRFADRIFTCSGLQAPSYCFFP